MVEPSEVVPDALRSGEAGTKSGTKFARLLAESTTAARRPT